MTAAGSRPRVALATSAAWPTLGPDDDAIAPALSRRGVDAEIAVWTDRAVNWNRFDLVLVRSCWDYHDDLPRWLAWIDERAVAGATTRLANAPEVLRWNATKVYLRDLESRGIATIPTRWLNPADLASPEVLDAALAASPWRDVVLKPAVSAGALATFHLTRASSSQGARPALPPPTALASLRRRAPAMLQPFVREIAAAGEWSLLFFGDEPSHAVLKTPAPGDFRVQERHGGVTRSLRADDDLWAFGRRVLAAAHAAAPAPDDGPFVYARVDVVITSTGPWLVELEVTEPALFLSPAAGAGVMRGATPADRLADAVVAALARGAAAPHAL